MAIQRVSQRALAEATGRTQTQVSDRLNGKVPISLDDVERISHALGLSVEQLLFSESPAQRRSRVS